MATAIKKCRVCGADYEVCRTLRRTAGVFRWQDVACCPEHGSIYLAQIEASRAGNVVKDKPARSRKAVVETVEESVDIIDNAHEEEE